MKMSKIFEEKPHIKKAVYDRFPELKKERTCRLEKSMRDQARFEMAKKMYKNPEI